MSGAIHIGIAGLGTVGAGVVKLLQQKSAMLQARCGRSLRLTAVSAREQKRDRGVDLSAYRWHADACALAEDPQLDVVVELIGGEEGMAKRVVETALAHGKPVVTANKALIATHGAALISAAEARGLPLCFEAAVAGGTPIIGLIRDDMVANRVNRVSGILNGSCNFILTTMERTGRDFSDVLAEAQAHGYVEADPSLDVDGIDTAHKLAILCGLAFGHAPAMEPLPCTGIRAITPHDIAYANELGYRIKLLGVAELTPAGIHQHVAPYLVPHRAPMASVDASFNAIELHGDQVGRIFIEGRGAGPAPTASAIVADLVSIARGIRAPALSVSTSALTSPNFMPIASNPSSYYLRLRVLDKPGVLAAVTQIFAQHAISVGAIIQRERAAKTPAEVVITTHPTTETSMQSAYRAITLLPEVIDPPTYLPMEEL